MQRAMSSSTRARPGGVRRRENGRRVVSGLTRAAIAGSIALTAAFSAVAGAVFSGHSSTAAASAGSEQSSTTSSHPAVALPPTTDGRLVAPAQPPIASTGSAPPVTSGGS